MSLSSPRFPEVKDTVSASRRHLARPVGQVLVDAVVGEALLVRRVFAQPAFLAGLCGARLCLRQIAHQSVDCVARFSSFSASWRSGLTCELASNHNAAKLIGPGKIDSATIPIVVQNQSSVIGSSALYARITRMARHVEQRRIRKHAIEAALR
jgi:hypothetical protein